MKAFSTHWTAQHIHTKKLRPLGLAFRKKGKCTEEADVIAIDTILRRTPSGYSCQPKKPHLTRTSQVAYRENWEEYPCWDSRAGEKKVQRYWRGRVVWQSSGLQGQNKPKRHCRNQWFVFTTKTELTRWHFLFFQAKYTFCTLRLLFSLNYACFQLNHMLIWKLLVLLESFAMHCPEYTMQEWSPICIWCS